MKFVEADSKDFLKGLADVEKPDVIVLGFLVTGWSFFSVTELQYLDPMFTWPKKERKAKPKKEMQISRCHSHTSLLLLLLILLFCERQSSVCARFGCVLIRSAAYAVRRRLVGPDADFDELLALARQTARHRVVWKQPLIAPVIIRTLCLSVSTLLRAA